MEVPMYKKERDKFHFQETYLERSFLYIGTEMKRKYLIGKCKIVYNCQN